VGSPQTVMLTNGTAVTTATAPLAAGSYGFQAEFLGDAADSFPDVVGPCEPFTVNTVTVGPCVLGYPDGTNPPRSEVAFNESSVLVSAGLFGTGSNQHVGVF